MYAVEVCREAEFRDKREIFASCQSVGDQKRQQLRLAQSCIVWRLRSSPQVQLHARQSAGNLQGIEDDIYGVITEEAPEIKVRESAESERITICVPYNPHITDIHLRFDVDVQCMLS